MQFPGEVCSARTHVHLLPSSNTDVLLGSPLPQSSFQVQPSKQSPRGSPIRDKGACRRQKERRHAFRKFQPSSSDQTFIDIDFHEDFPPLPKSVKPTQSPTLQKLAHGAAVAKEPPSAAVAESNLAPNLIESDAIVSRPQTSGNLPDGGTLANTPANTPTRNNGVDIDHDPTTYRSSVQGTPATVPRAPPPSSAEMSTAGNTAPSTPTIPYVRPRITLQNLQDRLRAHAIVTLQEEGALTSTPVGPLHGQIVAVGDLEKKLIKSRATDIEVTGLIDTTVGRGGSVFPIDDRPGNEWTDTTSLIKM